MTSRKHKSSEPISNWKLGKESVKELRSGWKRYVAIIAFVAVPVDLIGLTGGTTTGDPTVGAYSSFISLIMNVALIWAIIQKFRTGVVPRASSAYYDGSTAIVRFLLVSAALVIMLIPAALGAAIYLAATQAGIDSGAPIGEQLLIDSICFLIALPSIHLLIRFGLAPIAAIDSDLRPLAALRYARQLTLGKYWRMFTRYAALLLLIIIVAIPIALITALLATLKLVPVATIFFQLATTFTALPIANIYLLKLYHALEPKPKADITPTEDDPIVEDDADPVITQSVEPGSHDKKNKDADSPATEVSA